MANMFEEDAGKVGLTFEEFRVGEPVERLTLTTYKSELYVSLRGTVMDTNIETSKDDWYRVTDFNDLLTAIRGIKADAELTQAEIVEIRTQCQAIIDEMRTATDNANTATDNANEATSVMNALNALVTQQEAVRNENEQQRKQQEAGRQEASEAQAAQMREIQEDWAHQKTDINTTIETATDAAQRAVEAAGSVNEEIEKSKAQTAAAKAATDNANAEAAKIQPALDKMQQDFEDQETQRKNTFDSKEAERDNAVSVATALTPRVEALEDCSLAVNHEGLLCMEFEQNEEE